MQHLLLPGLAALLFAAGPLAASSTSATMAVSARVEEGCNLDVRPMVFGSVSSGNPRFDAQTSLGIACTPAASYVVTLDDGQQGANGRRRMSAAQGNGFLEYDLYRDAARTQRWGTSAANSVSGVVPASGTVTLDVYGRITASEAKADSYGDVVTVTVSF